MQLSQTSRVQHTTRARLLRRPQHVGRVSPNRPRRTIRQLHHEQQYAVPSLERLRREQPPEQRMRPGDDSDLTRQNRTKMLQSVALTAGTGKSHLLVALGVAAVHAGHRFRYFTAADLVDTLYRGLADNSVGRVIDTLLRNDLIILDLCRDCDYAEHSGVGAGQRRLVRPGTRHNPGRMSEASFVGPHPRRRRQR